jgi:ERF superfamily
METSAEIKNIAAAVKNWHELAVTVSKDATNPHFRSKFTSLDNMIETIRKPLASCGLSFAQFPDGDGLTTILMHTSGEWLKSTANLKLAKEDPQGQGSAYTYGRRYALSAMLGLAADEDDDGDGASAPRQSRQTAPQRAKSADVHLGLIRLPKDPAIELAASKERVLSLLKLHKVPCKTKRECEDSVFDLTGFTLEPVNFDQIAETLSARLEKKDAAN